jgi:curved DNA-binding protein CbpA
MTYYEVLGIAPSASTEEVEQAFRRLARQVHPDLNSGDPVRAEARMKELNEIRDILADPLLRAAYDERLRSSHPPTPAPPPPAPASPGRGAARIGVVAILGGTIAAGLFTLWPERVAPNVRPSTTGGAAILDEDTAPLLAVPTTKSARPVPSPTARPARAKLRGRGTIRLGSTTEDVFAAFGPPDRVQPGRQTGDATLHYGSLRLEITNGRVTGGDAAR